jgi:hypothetical protein
MRAQEELARRESYQLPESKQELFIASAEDMILEKLRWYELGNRISDRQWQDVQGILKIKRPELDFDYLKSRAVQMNLSDLLQEACKQVGSGEPEKQSC